MAILPGRNRYGVAVLVAISIPIFTTQLEKAREATDASNIRAAYAEVVAEALTNDGNDTSVTVNLTQKQDGWQTSGIKIADGNIEGTTTTNDVKVTTTGTPTANGKAVIAYTHAGTGSTDKATVTITYQATNTTGNGGTN